MPGTGCFAPHSLFSGWSSSSETLSSWAGFTSTTGVSCTGCEEAEEVGGGDGGIVTPPPVHGLRALIAFSADVAVYSSRFKLLSSIVCRANIFRKLYCSSSSMLVGSVPVGSSGGSGGNDSGGNRSADTGSSVCFGWTAAPPLVPGVDARELDESDEALTEPARQFRALLVAEPGGLVVVVAVGAVGGSGFVAGFCVVLTLLSACSRLLRPRFTAADSRITIGGVARSSVSFTAAAVGGSGSTSSCFGSCFSTVTTTGVVDRERSIFVGTSGCSGGVLRRLPVRAGPGITGGGGVDIVHEGGDHETDHMG
uniref:Uncharacterized protein n=1 Tax=Anopheles coluzzii TaxID=1518534 RepID=A0A8W7P1R3_ANOCL